MLSVKNFVLLIVSLCFSLVLYVVFRAASSPLRSVPGPLLARFTRFWYFRASVKGDFHIANPALHKKYGKIVRVAPNMYSIDDPEAAKIIYNVNNVFPKTKWYWASSHPDPDKSNIFAEGDNKEALRMRQNFAPAFQMSALLTYEPHADECWKLLNGKLRGFAAAREVIDLGHWMLCYAFDIQGRITFSKRFGFLDRGEDIGGVHEGLNQRLLYGTHIGIYPGLHPYTFAVINFIAGATTGKVDYSVDFTIKQIEERKAQEKPVSEGPDDMLTKYLDGHNKDPEKFTYYDVIMGAFGNIVAGADTTWISLNAILYNLLKSPESLRKLQQEIDGKTKTGELSDPVTWKEARDMPYLQAVIRETQRVYPATGLPLWRFVPEGGTTLCGKFFPAGTIVGINNWVAHRNPTVFGPDPDKFRPERWLDSDAERVAEMGRYYMPFGMGARACQGQAVGLLEMSKLIPQLIRNFDFELEDRLKKGEWTTSNRWFVKQLDFRCRVKLREGVKKE